jgi:integrase
MRKSERVIVFADRAVRSVLVNAEKRREFRVADTRGNAMDRLVLEAHGNGSGTWRVHYDVRQGGRRRRRKLVVGDHASKLHGVRSAWLGALKALDEGRDPENERRTERAARGERDARLFDHLCDDFLAFKVQEGKRTVDEDTRMLAVYVRPFVGAMPAAEVDENHIEAILEPIKARRSLAQATAVLVLLKTIFNYARKSPRWKRAGVRANPAADIVRPSKTKARTRRLSDEEIRSFWLEVDQARVEPATALGLKLALVLGRRTNELVQAVWSEFDLDRAEPRWTIPVERTKNKRAEVVIPLSDLALQLLCELRKLAGRSSCVFPSSKGADRPCNEGLLRRALSRMLDDGLLQCPRFSPHDFRRTMAQRMEDELDVAPHVVAAALGQIDGTVRGKHYSQAKRLRQLRAAFAAYELHLLRIVEGAT